MGLNKYAFIIPTKNRPECIAYYLQMQVSNLERAGFDIIICDSSADNATKEIVNEYKKEHANVFYDTYLDDEQIQGIDAKGFDICKEYCTQYAYIWLCSDGTIIDIENVFPVVEPDLVQGKDLVVISNFNVLKSNDLEFDDAKDLCMSLCWRMTLLGSVIASGAVFQELVREYPYNNDEQTLWLPPAYFKLFANKPLHASYHCVTKAFSINPYKKGSFWYVSGGVLWQWGKVWCDSIDSLPAYYDSIKNAVILSHDKHMRVFALSKLDGLKTTGNLTLNKVMCYRKYIRRVTKTPFILFLWKAIFP